MSRISLYELKEASSGTAPAFAADSDPSPVDLAIDYGSLGGIFWSSVTGGNALDLNDSIYGLAVATGIDGSKYSALNGLKTVTISVVWSRSGQSNTGGQQIITSIDGVLDVWVQGDTIIAVAPDNNGFFWDGPTDATPVVLTIVVDTSQADPADRVLLFINSTPQTPTFSEVVTHDMTWTVGDRIRIGGATSGFGEYCPNGKIAALSIYTEAQSAQVIESRAANWLANNDTDPDPSTGPITFLGSVLFDLQEQSPAPQSIDVPPGASLCVFFWSYWKDAGPGGTLSFVTLNGSPFTDATSIPIAGDPYAVGASYLVSPPAGTGSIQWAVTTPADFGPMVMVAFFSGTNLLAPIVDSGSDTHTEPSSSTTVSSSGTDYLIGGVFADTASFSVPGATLLSTLYSTTQGIYGQIVSWPAEKSPQTETSILYPRLSVLSLKERSPQLPELPEDDVLADFFGFNF